jgi:hypothetical protein
MRGAIPRLSQHVFLALYSGTGTTLNFSLDDQQTRVPVGIAITGEGAEWGRGGSSSCECCHMHLNTADFVKV